MTDREQVRREAKLRRDTATALARGWTHKPLPQAKIYAVGITLVAEEYLALLAELEQAERREEGERTRIKFLTAALGTSEARAEQAERTIHDERQKNDQMDRMLKGERRLKVQAERERDEAREALSTLRDELPPALRTAHRIITEALA